MIDVKNLSVSLSNKPIIKNVQFEIKEGQFISIIGPNGSGKTTLIKTLAGLIKKYQGEIKFYGNNIKNYKPREFSRVAAIFTPVKNFVPDFTVEDFVSFGREPYRKWYQFNLNSKAENDLILSALKKTDCLKFFGRKLSTLSTGEFQRVRLALILAQDSQLIVLDEPITHLDLKAQHEFLNILQDLNKRFKKTIISVFHEINHAVKVSDKIIALKGGEIIFSGDSADFINEAIIKQIFNIDSNILIEPHTGRKYLIP